jgi:hypothetical protein
MVISDMLSVLPFQHIDLIDNGPGTPAVFQSVMQVDRGKLTICQASALHYDH